MSEREKETSDNSSTHTLSHDPAAEALVCLRDPIIKRSAELSEMQQSPRKRGRDALKSPKKLQLGPSRKSSQGASPEGSGAVVDTRYNLRAAQNPFGTSPSKTQGGRKPRKSPAPKIMVLGNKLKNFLKLQKAHLWCYYEWFYSDIDKPFFEGDNDFCQYLQELFPTLKTRQLRRSEWSQLRRLMGKPRRCSCSFFEEERALLHQRRAKVRCIQQGLVTDFSDYKDLPDNIPQSLVVGTRVTGWLRHNGASTCHSGQIEAVLYGSNQYLVSFDRPDLGKHHIPDTEVRSMEDLQTFSISELESEQQKQWEVRATGVGVQMSPKPILPSPFKSYVPHSSDDLIGDLQTSPQLPCMDVERMGDIRAISKWYKLLSQKKAHIGQLQLLNSQVEKRDSRGESASVNVQRQFAQVIVALDDVNKQLQSRQEAFRKAEAAFDNQPSSCQDPYSQEASSMLERICQREEFKTESQTSLPLIAKMTSILLQIEAVSGEEQSLDLSTLASSIQDLGLSISPANYQTYQSAVETPLRYIQAGLNPTDTLHPMILAEGDHTSLN